MARFAGGVGEMARFAGGIAALLAGFSGFMIVFFQSITIFFPIRFLVTSDGSIWLTDSTAMTFVFN